MRPSYLQALLGQTRSPVHGAADPQYQIKFRNQLLVPIQISLIDPSANRIPIEIVPPSQSTVTAIPAYVGDQYLATSATSGSFVGILTFSDPTTLILSFTPGMLAVPFDIGPVPLPSSEQLIPNDSPLVMVGCGPVGGMNATPGGNAVVREQAWQRSAESYCLAPGETKAVSLTMMEGRQETTSDEDTLKQSLSITGKGGYGPISMTIAASLNSTSTHSQTVTVQTQTVRYVSDTLTNTTSATVMFLKWALIDIVTVVDPTGVPLANLVTSQSPMITSGPFDPNALPAPPARAHATAGAATAATGHLPDYMRHPIEATRALDAQDARLARHAGSLVAGSPSPPGRN